MSERCPECRTRFGTRFQVALHITKDHANKVTAKVSPLLKRHGPHAGKVGVPRNTKG